MRKQCMCVWVVGDLVQEKIRLNLIVFAHMYNQSPSLLVILLGRPA